MCLLTCNSGEMKSVGDISVSKLLNLVRDRRPKTTHLSDFLFWVFHDWFPEIMSIISAAAIVLPGVRFWCESVHFFGPCVLLYFGQRFALFCAILHPKVRAFSCAF